MWKHGSRFLRGNNINLGNFSYRFCNKSLIISLNNCNTKTNCTYLFADFRNVTIISDSMAKNVTGIFGATPQIFSGKTISQVANKIQYGYATLEPFDYVIIHVGTNDLGDRAPYDHIISDFCNLIGICQNKKQAIKIIVSSILPRLVDLNITDWVRRKVNDHLQKSMSKSMRFKYVCSYKPFMRAGEVRRE